MRISASDNRGRPSRPLALGRLSAATLAVACAAGWAVGQASAAEPAGGDTLSVPVKILQAREVEPPTRMLDGPAPDPPPEPTLPDGKLPQYDVSRARETQTGQPLEGSSLRVILALDPEPILIEATVTINGQPFHHLREQRLQQLLRAAQDALEQDEEQGEEQDEDQDEEQDGEQDGSPDAEPTVIPGDNLTRMVRRYARATGVVPTADELRWLVSNWEEGPSLLVLNHNFQRFRAGQRPAFDVLDRNRDGIISDDELKLTVQSLNECDFNRDGVVGFDEIARAAEGLARVQFRRDPGTLVVLVPDASDASEIYLRLADRYASQDGPSEEEGELRVPRFDENQNGRFDESEIRALREMLPDLRIAIAFDMEAPEAGRVEVREGQSEWRDALAKGVVQSSEITLSAPGRSLSVSAVQAGRSDQVSIGAVDDGYPLLPRLDPNDDGRLTIRELRELEPRLRSFDRNGDGRLTEAEVRPPVRICFGLGPVVHRELASIRSVAPSRTADLAAAAAPEWFTRMDRNRDRDVARDEFPGTDQQFKALDTDGDGLISAKEAIRFENASRGPQTESTPSDSEARASESTVPESPTPPDEME